MFATDVGHRLAKAGHVVFMDNSIYNGQPWAQRLMDELRRADVVVCVITSGYVRSPWGLAEAAIARYRGRLLPVLAEPDVRRVVGASLVIINSGGLFATSPSGAAVIGPGCPQLNQTHDDWDNQGDWAFGPGDYRGAACGGQSLHILDQSSEPLFRWHVELRDRGAPHTCRVWAYVPAHTVGNGRAQYSFYSDDGNSALLPLRSPSTVDQDSASGWTYLGSTVVPAGTYLLTVLLGNPDTIAQQTWNASAGDLAYTCS